MNSQLEAARHSSILNVAAEKSTKALEYTAEKALKFPGILSRQTVELECTSEFLDCVAQNSERTISLPKFGFLSSIVLEFNTDTLDTAESVSKNRGFTHNRGADMVPAQTFGDMYEVFDEFELRTQSGKSLTLMKSASAQNLLVSDPKYANERLLADSQQFGSIVDPAVKGAISTASLQQLLEADKTGRKTFIAIPFKMFDMFSTCPDLLTLEQIQLVIRGAPTKRLQNRADFVAGLTLKLHLAYHLPTAERHEELVKMQHASGSAFNYISTSYKYEPVRQMITPSGSKAKSWTGKLVSYKDDIDVTNPYYKGMTVNNPAVLNTAHDLYQVSQVLQPIELDITTAQPVKRTFVHVAHGPTGRRGIVTGIKVTDAGNTLFEIKGRALLNFLGKSREIALSGEHAAHDTLFNANNYFTTATLAVDSGFRQYTSYTTRSDDLEPFGCAVIDWGLLNCFKDELMTGSAVSFHQMSAPRIEVSASLPPIKLNRAAKPGWLKGAHHLASSNETALKASVRFGDYFGSLTLSDLADKYKVVTSGAAPVAAVANQITAIKAVATIAGNSPYCENSMRYVEGMSLNIGCHVAHEVMEVTTIQPSASGRNRQIRVIGTR